MTSNISKIAAAAAILISLGQMAHAENKTFYKPKLGADRLDLCINWGVGCGKPAADAWCQAKGYTKSTGHSVAHNIGAATRTRLIGTGAVCDQGFCDGFKAIKCFKPTPVQFYYKPKWGADRLDWCLNWGTGCGKPAADKFCSKKGFARAKNFSIDADIGAVTRTRLITTGAVCDQGYCDGFKGITCES